MRRPLIGITMSCCEGDHPAQQLDSGYVDAVEAAGGCPVLLAMPRQVDALRPILDCLDGLLVTGGPAVCDGLVGELPGDLHPTPARRQEADRFSFEVMEQRQRPILGICYGMQFVNARCGGTINADLQAHFGVGPHAPGRNDGQEVHHEITVEAHTHLAAALGDGPRQVNSYHIQSVVEVVAPLRISARSADGIVEGVETEDGRIMGVQFHPERMGAGGAGLFHHLVQRAAG